MDPSKIVLAIPKKGPLSPQTLSLLDSAHITYTRHPRLDIAYSSTLPIILAFLPASDIPQFVAQENVDFGICGDVDISESGLSSQLTRVLGLGYGKCALDVQVQTFPPFFRTKVPMNSPLTSLKDVNDVRVATTHDRIVSTHFPQTKILYISGGVDVACAVLHQTNYTHEKLDMADVIVDLKITGSTMQRKNLRSIGTLLSSEACLMSKKNVQDVEKLKWLDVLRKRFLGVIEAEQYVLCTYNIKRAHLSQARKITPGRKAPTISPLEDGDWVSVSAMVEREGAVTIMDMLEEVGATDILLFKIKNFRSG